MLREYQEEVGKAVHRQGTGYWPPLIILSRLAEEVGEASAELAYANATRPENQKDLYGGKDGAFIALAGGLRSLGEMGRELNHFFGPKKKREGPPEPSSLKGELGDILFTVICMANAHAIDLDQALQGAIAKCDGRDRDRFRQGA